GTVDEPPRRRLERVVVAAERDDAHRWSTSRKRDEPVGLEAGAADERRGGERTGARLDGDGPFSLLEADHRRAELQLPAVGAYLLGEGPRHRPVVDDRGLGRVQCADADRMGLDRTQ